MSKKKKLACHELWSQRNKKEHNEDFLRPLEPINHILQKSEEYSKAIQLYATTREEGIGNMYVGWKSLTSSMIKLNTDGARKANSVASVWRFVARS